VTATNFAACFAETERWEGGYVDNPHDPGGATLKGVTQAVYTAWRASHGLPPAPVRNATDADIAAIYRAQYWNAVRGDDLYDGLDLVMTDTGWGSGPVTAVKILQRILSMPVIDGHLGVRTLAAVKSSWNSPGLIHNLCTARMEFFQRLPTWRYFGKGWTARLTGIQSAALAMNAAARRSTPIPTPP
jgi:lysozyme family protein